MTNPPGRPPPQQGLPPQYGRSRPPKRKHTARNIVLGVAAAVVAFIVLGAIVSATGGSTPAASTRTAHASSAAATQQAPAQPAARMTAAQTAAMNRWYSGATLVQVSNVCGDVYRVYSDNVAVNSGTGSSSLEGDTIRLQTDAAAALGNPPPVAADAVIWKRVLTAYSDAAGGPTNSGLVAAARSAKNAAWAWSPPSGGTLLVCINVSI